MLVVLSNGLGDSALAGESLGVCQVAAGLERGLCFLSCAEKKMLAQVALLVDCFAKSLTNEKK